MKNKCQMPRQQSTFTLAITSVAPIFSFAEPLASHESLLCKHDILKNDATERGIIKSKCYT